MIGNVGFIKQTLGNTERSEQKDQGHAPGQGQGVKPIAGSRDRVPSGAWGRASIGVSLLSGAEWWEKNIKVGHKTKRCRSGKLCTAFVVSFTNFPRKERQRFCGGRTWSQNVGDAVPYILASSSTVAKSLRSVFSLLCIGFFLCSAVSFLTSRSSLNTAPLFALFTIICYNKNNCDKIRKDLW